MHAAYQHVLSPVGVTSAHIEPHLASRESGGRRAIGLIDNSKPNVSYFIEALRDGLRRSGEHEIVSVAKPRSAAACPDLEALVNRCRFVINAVAD